MVNPVAVMELLLSPFFTSLLNTNKEHLTKRQTAFTYVDSAFPQLCFLKSSFKSVDISNSYAK